MIAVLFAKTPDAVGVVHRCVSVKAAREKCGGLADEKQCAVREASEHDGMLFPPSLAGESDDFLAKAARCGAVTAGKDAPPHVVVVDIDAPAKSKWAARVLGFASAKSAATYALHCYRTAGSRLKSIEMHAFEGWVQAAPRMHLQGGGVFDANYAIADIAALEAAAA
ncbi:hypothetical protein SO694_00151018 [Aureococcus anophagefferens]|uniref:Uncharacterized protein n=2 Tax=Aureococcus anophagefferens TaxID=44056 RepID=A0ABR1GF33_AURAN|nr:expressed protein [Aureococcus anophagefferens]EGB03477.1 expressed protein [Aureococcus anophagefferens]KAH8092956.1 hypothetical protein JL720_5126 [Aureococcus anophagefferens]|mmetsp:Transcript_886/g.2949  ORF Transcript_886/g.2949 Transcript_886/m.2949 type:complete len:167 (+) Transcript_886:103-603(+)|eukprot:XP_009041806.1 expressed protein [Aureococcus anophagefferens]